MRKFNPKVKNVIAITLDFLSSFFTAIIFITAVIFILIKVFGWHIFSVDSPSMAPVYPEDSLIVVQPIAPEEIEVGDVITYVLNEDGILVTHRVVDIDVADESFITKGDGNEVEDLPVLWENVVGKVFLGIPGLGPFVRFVSAEGNRVAIILIIVSVLALSLVWDIVANVIKKKKEKRESDKKQIDNSVESLFENDLEINDPQTEQKIRDKNT